MARVYAPGGSHVQAALDGVEFRLEECARCGMIYQLQIPDDELSFTLYEEWISPETTCRNEVEGDLAARLSFVAEIAQVVRYFGGVPGNIRCMDYGMGWGTWCAVAKGLGCQVSGTELSEARKREAVARGIAIVEESEIPGQEFHLINTEQVFEHLPDPRSTVRLLASGLRPGGILKICVPPHRNIRRLLQSPDWNEPTGSPRSLNPVAPLEHLNCYSKRSLEMLGESAGLARVRVPLGTSFLPLHGPNPIQAAKNMLRPLARNMGLRDGHIWLRKPITGSAQYA